MGIFRKNIGHEIFVAISARILCVLLAVSAWAHVARAQQTPPSSGETTVRLEADQQHKEGDVFFADGNVDIHYRNYRLRGDHVQYNAKTYLVAARGHVQLDVDTQHLSADSGNFDVQTGEGRFEHVRGEVRVEHRPNAYVLLTPNPLVFEAREVQRIDNRTYLIEQAWLTVCEPDKPTWKFFTAHATLHVDRKVALVNANFRLFRIPLLYLPYATVPAGNKVRQSGFLMPEVGDTSVKGLVLGDAYYWAPKDWTDISLGAEYLSRRGWQQNVDFRAKPWENVSISAKYFGVIDRGLPTLELNSSGTPVEELWKQGGHNAQFELDAQLKGGWRAVADLNQLTSLTFQLAFAPTFSEAVNSEIRSSAFLTNNFDGFSVNLAVQNYQGFLNVPTATEPETTVVLRSAPEGRISSVDQSPWKNLPIYFGLDAFAGAVHRSDPQNQSSTVNGTPVESTPVETSPAVERSEFAPRVVVPLHWGTWLGVTTSFTVRTMSYGSQIISGVLVNQPLQQTTDELSVDIRPATLERVWESRGGKWKHTIEPEIIYNYVLGANQFDRIIRFDEEDTITDTNEFQYSITQRLFHRTGEGQANELVSWRLAQKYYFDPTFNGALVPGTRNVFEALDSISPFAFADEPRRFSPVESDLRVMPGGIYDAEVRLEYDTVRQKVTTAGTLLKIHPVQNFNFSVAQFSIDNSDVLQPLANQIRMQAGYGDLNGRGWNASMGFGYDIKQQSLQSQLVQIGYNGSCCGLAVGYQRLSLGPVRAENQFRVALIIANLGTFGNLRRQQKIF